MKQLLLLPFFFTCACTTLGVSIPTGRLESPEANRSWHPRVSLGLSQQQTLTYARDASRRPYTAHEPEKELSVEYPVIKAGIGLPLGFEISARSGVIYGTSFATAKFQLIGPRAGEGKSGDFSLAVTGAVGGSNYKMNGDQNGVMGAGGHNWSSTQNSHGRDGALIIGYRPSDRIILYGGPFYTDWEFNGNIKHERSDDGLSPAANYDLYGRGYRRGVNLAFEWSTLGYVRWYFVPELVVSQLNWSEKEEATHADFAFATGVIF